MNLLAAGIVLLSTLIIQWHSMAFWSEQTGQIGYLWSICFESAVLWLWWQDKLRLRIVGFVGTLVLLSGPLYIVSQPVIASYVKNQEDINTKVVLERRLQMLHKKNDSLLSLASKRSGWKSSLDNVDNEINKTYASLERISLNKGNTTTASSIALFVVELLALCVIFIAQITGVRYLNASYVKSVKNKKTEPENTDAPTRLSEPTPEPEKEQKTSFEANFESENSPKDSFGTENSEEPTSVLESSIQVDSMATGEPDIDPNQEKKEIVENEQLNNIGAEPIKSKPVLTLICGDVKGEAKDELDFIREWLESFIEHAGSIKEAGIRLNIDRRELSYARNKGGRNPKPTTWEDLKKQMNGDKSNVSRKEHSK